jgi:DNA-binding SARP family transcriptional activator
MNVGVLGPVELWSAGNRIDLGSARERCILAILVMTPRAPVPAEALIDRLWGPDPPPKAREDLYSYITRIRRKLQEITEIPVTLTALAGGYILDIAPEATDLHLFRLKVRQARSMADSGDVAQAVTLLRQAEELWRGEALAGLSDDWSARMRHSLDEERRAATLKRVDLELDLGLHADLIGELRRLAAQYPLDETVAAASMIALYRSGRVTEALEIYREIHSGLTEQGMEPGPALADLHQRLLRRDPLLAITPIHRRPPGTGQPDTLPPIIGELVDRTSELDLLTRAPQEPGTPSVWIIEGMPGVGKTALAVHAARTAADRFPDAQLFVSFRVHAPGHQPLGPAELLGELLRSLGIPADRIPGTLTKGAARWRDELASRRAVVVLDDVPGIEQVRPFLPTHGSCLILITTRRRLPESSGVAVMHLDVLSPAAAIALFAQVAGSSEAADNEAAARAVRLCGYLPLAIQVAARKLMQGEPATLAELVEALTHSRDLSGPGGVIGAPVSSAFAVSYQALGPAQRRLFRLLAVHPCPEVTASAAAALIAASPAEASSHLDALADDHLLERRADGRFGCHDLLRAYALERTKAEDPEPARRQATGRALDYYTFAASRADRVLYPHRRRRPIQTTPAVGQPQDFTTPSLARAWLEAERSSLIHAARYAATHEWKTHCTDLAHVLAAFLATSGYWNEAITVHQLALQAARDLGDQVRIAQTELELAHACLYTGHYDDALTHAQHAAAIYRDASDRRGEAEALDRVGTIHDFCGRFLDALAYYDEAASYYRDANDLRGLADATGHAGIAHACLGHMDEALSHLTRALTLYRQSGDRRGEARTLNNLGELHRKQGYYRDAIAQYQESAQIFQQIGGRQNEALLHHNMGIVQYYTGHYDEAVASYRQALTTYRAIGDLRSQAGAFNDIGAVYQAKELYAEALAHHHKAQEIAEQIGEQYELTIALRGTGDGHAGLGNYTEAATHYDAARQLARHIGDPYQEALTIARTAETALHTQGPEAARIHFRQALAIFEQLGVPEAEQTRIRLHVLGTQDL